MYEALAPVALAFTALLLAAAPYSSAQPQAGRLSDGFDSYPAGQWPEGSTRGNWRVDFSGFGSVGIVRPSSSSSNKVHYQEPLAATSPGETHASLVTSAPVFDGVDYTVRVRTVKQLRTGSAPNPWEVAWVVWGYADDRHFYYFVPKPNGVELGKAHPGYPGGQRFLYTSGSPRAAVGSWHTVRVRQVGNVIDVWLDGRRVVSGLRDEPGPAGDAYYPSGRVGMYNEDARAYFDDVRAASTTS